MKTHRIAAFLFAAFFFHSSAHAWWNSAWTIRKQVTIDSASSGADSIAGAPVLLRLHDGNFSFGAVKPDGSDLRFIAADEKTVLPYHVEKFDAVLNEAFVWVKLPAGGAGTKTTFWLYYGNPSDKAGKGEDAKATYDSDTQLVYHFGAQPAYDFSMNGNNAESPGTPVEGALIGHGLRFDGRNSVALPQGSGLAWNDRASFTWSAWIKLGSVQPHGAVFARRDNGRSLVIGVDNGAPFAEVVSTDGAVRTSIGAPLPPGAWKHLAVVSSGSKLSVFVDGELYGSVAAVIPSLSGSSNLGGEGFVGELDELMIAKVARNQGFLKFLAYSQSGDRAASVVSLGADEQDSNWMSGLKNGYVGVIIGSLTVDGWVVIGLLGIMSIISWFVMIRKGIALNRISKGNSDFLKEWSQVATDLSVLDAEEDARTMGGRLNAQHHRSMRDSTLYKVYHVGVAEIRHRHTDSPSVDARVLSSRSIHAIRAALDGSVVRETQKLNSGMVLLTIAISGGPFLGLLGTVVGVMITFAAVAQAGDVNVNAIAPGIAAALAATVAGLAVAIPALFGYNYLLTGIKVATTNMHVFIDEFVTKMAEFYSETEISGDVGSSH